MKVETLSTLLQFIERVSVTGTQEAHNLLVCKQELAEELQRKLEERRAPSTNTDNKSAELAA